MNFLTMIALVLAVIALLTYLWLSLRAFRIHPGWGLGVMFLFPATVIPFGLRFWETEKVPFLLCLLNVGAAAGLSLFLFGNWGGWELLDANARVQEGITTQHLSRKDAQEFLRISHDFREMAGFSPGTEQTARYLQQYLRQEAEQEALVQANLDRHSSQDDSDAPPLNEQVESVPEKHTRLVYRTIPLKEARKYIGATVKVTRRNVGEKEYRLTGVTARSLQFAQRNTNGAYSFAFRMSDIEKLRVLIREESTTPR
jgi:hypothetical protein